MLPCCDHQELKVQEIIAGISESGCSRRCGPASAIVHLFALDTLFLAHSWVFHSNLQSHHWSMFMER